MSGKDCVAIGNVIRSTEVPAAMVRAFEAEPGKPLAERLCAALKAGHDAGGEFKQVTSAGLLVVAGHPFPYVDLRADDHPDPIAEITRLWNLYAPDRRQLRQARVRARQPRGQRPLRRLPERGGSKGGAGEGEGGALSALRLARLRPDREMARGLAAIPAGVDR